MPTGKKQSAKEVKICAGVWMSKARRAQPSKESSSAGGESGREQLIWMPIAFTTNSLFHFVHPNPALLVTTQLLSSPAAASLATIMPVAGGGESRWRGSCRGP